MNDIPRRQLVPLSAHREEFLPTKAEQQRAHQLEQDFYQTAEAIDTLFELQVRILRELHANPRLCRTLGYDTIWEFINDPEVSKALRVKVGSRTQLYRVLGLAEIDERFPDLAILREPHLTKLTQTSILPKLKALQPDEIEKAEAIVEEVRASTFEKLNAEPLPTIQIKTDAVKIDGKSALRVAAWTPLAIRALSTLLHFSPHPQFRVEGQKVIARYGDRFETVMEFLTDDEDIREYVRDRLKAIRT